MDAEKEKMNPLKQAIGRSIEGGLPSNFNYRMMEQIRVEAEKQRKRRAFRLMFFLIAVSFSFLMMGVCTLFFYLELTPMDYLTGWELKKVDWSSIGFYGYLGVLVLLLLGLDHWIRNRQRKRSH